MYYCINPGGEESTAKERDIYSLSSCRMTRNSVLCLKLKGYHRTLTFSKETERLRLLPTTSKTTQIFSKLQFLLPSVAAIAYPLDQQWCSDQGKRYDISQADNEIPYVSFSRAIERVEAKTVQSRRAMHARKHLEYMIFPLHLSGKMFFTAFQSRGWNTFCISSLASHWKSFTPS